MIISPPGPWRAHHAETIRTAQIPLRGPGSIPGFFSLYLVSPERGQKPDTSQGIAPGKGKGGSLIPMKYGGQGSAHTFLYSKTAVRGEKPLTARGFSLVGLMETGVEGIAFFGAVSSADCSADCLLFELLYEFSEIVALT